jgi:hypothetical protein
VVTGFAGGYYLGTRAGRERYEQINKALRRARGSETFEAVADKTKAVVEERVDAARDRVDSARDTAEELIDSRLGNGQSEGPDPS